MATNPKAAQRICDLIQPQLDRRLTSVEQRAAAAEKTTKQLASDYHAVLDMLGREFDDTYYGEREMVRRLAAAGIEPDDRQRILSDVKTQRAAELVQATNRMQQRRPEPAEAGDVEGSDAFVEACTREFNAWASDDLSHHAETAKIDYEAFMDGWSRPRRKQGETVAAFMNRYVSEGKVAMDTKAADLRKRGQAPLRTGVERPPGAAPTRGGLESYRAALRSGKGIPSAAEIDHLVAQQYH